MNASDHQSSLGATGVQAVSPPRDTQWYYGVGDQRVGPIANDSLIALIQAAQIRPESLVWRAGMTNWVPAQQVPELAAALAESAHLRRAAPPIVPTGAPTVGDGSPDATGGVIPYKNAPALIAYYCGIFALIPGANFILGPMAIGLGVTGLRRAKANPLVKGKVHAWVGIVLGTLWTLVYSGLVGLIVIGAMR
jgi:hypothetical protein